jgi:glycerophosphoryl diester phosphodiesterase
VPTFAEVLALRERLSRELGRRIGVYPETKYPTYFRSAGLPLEEPLIRHLRSAGLDRRDAPVFVQSFEAGNLLAMRHRLGLRAPTVFLTHAAGHPFGDPTSYAGYLTPEGLRWLSGYVDGIGPDKNQIIPRRADGSLGQPTTLVSDAQAAGLAVHPYTFRAENAFLPTGPPRTAGPSTSRCSSSLPGSTVCSPTRRPSGYWPGPGSWPAAGRPNRAPPERPGRDIGGIADVAGQPRKPRQISW